MNPFACADTFLPSVITRDEGVETAMRITAEVSARTRRTTPSARRLTIALLAAALSCALVACSRNESAAEAAQSGMAAAESPADAAPAAPAAADAASAAVADIAEPDEEEVRREESAKVEEDSDGVETTTGVSADQVAAEVAFDDGERRFIRTAQADFRVKDVYASSNAIEDAVARHGGFVVDNSIRSEVLRMRRHAIDGDRLVELTEYAMHGEMTVRVPSAKTVPFLRAIAPQMEVLDQRAYQANDAQFDLLRRQLAWQRAQDGQRELGEAMRVGDRLDRKTETIAARGDARQQRDDALIEQKQYEDRIAFSTIRLSLRQDARVRSEERVDGDAVFRRNGPGFFRRLGEALRVGWDGVLELVLAAMTLWPLWSSLIAAAWLWRRLRTRLQERARDPHAAAPQAND